MNKLSHRVVLMVLALGIATSALAGELKLSMANGRVTLIAVDVPVRQILTEWARVGNTKIVNAEKVVGPTVTLHLVDRPEREVLDAVLRNVSGYVAAPRSAGSPGAAVYDRIFILATSAAPAYAPVASAPTFTRPPTPVTTVPDDDPVEPHVQPPPGTGQVPPGAFIPGASPNPQTAPVPGMLPNNPNQPQPNNQPLTAPRPGMLPPPTPGMSPNPYAPPQPIRPPTGRGGGPGSI